MRQPDSGRRKNNKPGKRNPLPGTLMQCLTKIIRFLVDGWGRMDKKDSFRDADLWSRRAQETVGTGGSSDSFPSVRCAFPPPGLNRVAVAGCTVRVRKARKLTAAGTVTDSHRVPGATLRPSPVPAAKIAIEIQSRKKKPALGAEPTAERSAAGPPGAWVAGDERNAAGLRARNPRTRHLRRGWDRGRGPTAILSPMMKGTEAGGGVNSLFPFEFAIQRETFCTL